MTDVIKVSIRYNEATDGRQYKNFVVYLNGQFLGEYRRAKAAITALTVRKIPINTAHDAVHKAV